MLHLTKKEKKEYKKEKFCHTCKENFSDELVDSENCNKAYDGRHYIGKYHICQVTRIFVLSPAWSSCS